MLLPEPMGLFVLSCVSNLKDVPGGILCQGMGGRGKRLDGKDQMGFIFRASTLSCFGTFFF